MPYFGPAPSENRPRLHRRSYTAPRTSGAFGPLGVLPRRTRPTLFSLAQDADADDDAGGTHGHGLPQLNPNNSLRISISNDADDTLRTHPAAVPFPRSSPTSPAPPRRPSVSRTTSTPILLSNGKPLKSSLKSSSSSPQIATSPTSSSSPTPHHPRARSAPSSPHLDHRKNVHFPTSELATIKVFNRSAKPASVSRIGGEDDTETETEGELSVGSNSGFIRGSSAVFPFPRSPLGQRRYEIDPDISSRIPTTNQPPYANVFLESLTFTPSLHSSPSSTPGISGTLLVRNIAYEKHVAVRFTLDDWQTTSEVSANHLVSLTTLPNTFIDQKRLTYGDIIALSPHQTQTASPTDPSSRPASSLSPQWDRFTFKIKLEDYAHPSLGGLTKRTMWLVARYTTGTGVETWDNNSGKNYKVAFREQPQQPQRQQDYLENTTALMQKRSRVFAVSSPPSFAPTTLTTTPISPMQQQQRQEHAKSIAETTLTKLKKLNLRNYAAPTFSPSVRAPIPAVARVNEKLELVNGFPAHMDVRRMENEKEEESKEERQPGDGETGRREEESDTESEESIETPVPTTVNSIVLGNAGGSEPGVRIRSRTPSPTDIRIRVGSDSGIDGVPLITFSPASPPGSSSIPPSSVLRGRQLASNNVMLAVPSKSMDSQVASEMGTSPPFSVMSDFTSSLTSRFWKKEVVVGEESVDKEKVDGVANREESIYWSWGGSSSTEQKKVVNDGEEEEVKKERMMLLDGIREKSTSSPPGGIRRVSPTGRQPSAGTKLANGGVVSPQPRGKQDWSKVGSGWMNKSNSPRGSPLSTPPMSPPPTVPSSGSSTPTLRPTTTTTTTTTTASSSTPTPTQSPSPSNTVATPQSQQDSVYQAFVRQWCFAQGPSHPVVGSGAGHNFNTRGGSEEYGYSAQQPPRRRRGGRTGADTQGGENGASARGGGSPGADGPLVV